MKLTVHAWIIMLITLALVLLLAFMLPFVHTTVFWIGLGCTVAMFIVCVIAYIRAFRRDETLTSKLLGWPIFSVSLTALVVQVLSGFLIMAVAEHCPVWGAVLAEALIFAVTLICLTTQDAVRAAEHQLDQQPEDKTQEWKAIRRKAAALAASIGTPEMRRLADDIRYADPMPTPLDAQLSALLDILSSYATEDNMKKANQLLAQRNTLAKDSKK